MRQKCSDPEFDSALAGWDPYIVSIVGGSADEPPGSDTDATTPAARTRELELMAWLREQRTG